MKHPTIRRFSSFALRITLLYALFSGLGAFISDRLLNMLISDKNLLTEWQTYKQWVIVAITAVWLFVLLSARQRAEQAQRESEERFHAVAQSANEAIIVADENGKIISWNKNAERLFLYAEHEVLGAPISILIPEPYLTRHRGAVHHFHSTGKSGVIGKTYEGDGLRKDSSIFPVEVSLSTWQTPQRRFFGAIIRDITERKRADEVLRQSEEQYRLLFENNPLPMWMYDLETLAFQAVNDVAVEKYGYSREEFFRMTIADIRPAEDIPRLLENVAQSRPALQHSGEWRHRLKDGKIIDVDITSHIITANGLQSVLVVAQDITERKVTEEKLKQKFEHILALRQIDTAITSSFDLKVSLDVLFTQVTRQLGVDAVDVLLFNTDLHRLEFIAGRGFRTNALQDVPPGLGESCAGRVVLDRQMIHIPDLKRPSDKFTRATSLEDEAFVCYYGVPLISKGKVKGVLEVFHRSTLKPDQEWLDFLNTLAGQCAIAVDNTTLFDNLQRSNLDLRLAYDATIAGWSHALDLRDRETEGHTQRVTEMTLKLARMFGLNEEELGYVRWGSLLHDIGKMGIPDHILLKPDRPTEEEWVTIRKHPQLAYEMLSPIYYLKSAIDIPYCHHEKWDGTGYPRGLKGNQIPLAARIFAVVDIWDAVRSDRPYRPAWKTEKALEHIRSLSGSHLDPKVVDAFLEMIRSEGLY